MQCFVGARWGEGVVREQQKVGRGLARIGFQNEFASYPPCFTFKHQGFILYGVPQHDPDTDGWTVHFGGWRDRADLERMMAIDQTRCWPRSSVHSVFKKVANYDGSTPPEGGPQGIYEEQHTYRFGGRLCRFTNYPEPYHYPWEQYWHN